MATFNYTVDTEPMANELQSVSRNVNQTTGAVVAMQTAVIAAEEAAADRVCSNVNKGFYTLIRSQISQKMAKLKSEVDSHLMQLVHQKKALLGIQSRMERDYNMISSRYVKLFNGLNSSLKQRVFELDKATTDFALKEVEKISNRSKYLTATVPVTQLESLTTSQKIVASNIKSRGQEVIGSMNSFLNEMKNQKLLTDQILITDSEFRGSKTVYLPVMIIERLSDSSGFKEVDLQVPRQIFEQNVVSQIENRVYEGVKNLNWKFNSSIDKEVSNNYNKLLNKSGLDERVKEYALRMFQENSFKTV